MTTTQATPTPDSEETRSKGNLAGALVPTLLVFTLIPLVIMAATAYFRAQNLLKEQATQQSRTLIESQLQTIDGTITEKEAQLSRLMGGSDFGVLFELAIHANPKGSEFNQIRQSVVTEFENSNEDVDNSSFDQFVLIDSDGFIKVASNTDWEGMTLADKSFLNNVTAEEPSTALYGLSPLYENQFFLTTSLEYKTSRGSSLGYLIGITGPEETQKLLQPLISLSPLAQTYFVLPSGQLLTFNSETKTISPANHLSEQKASEFTANLSDLQANSITTPRTLDNVRGDQPTVTQVQWFMPMHVGIALDADATAVKNGLSALSLFTIGLAIITLIAACLAIIAGIRRVTGATPNVSDMVAASKRNGTPEVRFINIEPADPKPAREGNGNGNGNGHGHSIAMPAIPVSVTPDNNEIESQAVKVSEPELENYKELARLYQASYLIAKADTQKEVFEAAGRMLEEAPYIFLILAVNNYSVEAVSASDENGKHLLDKIPRSTSVDSAELNMFVQTHPAIHSSDENFPPALRLFTQPLQFNSIAVLPIRKMDRLMGLLLVGSQAQALSEAPLLPYQILADLVGITLGKADSELQTRKQLKDVESLASISEAISTSSDLPSFFDSLHQKVIDQVGNFSFMIALYDERSNTISVPYSFENGQFLTIEPFPLGEGLTSILLRSGEPLILLEDTENKSAALGAKIQGSTAKSWMGAPMIVNGKPIGALIIQDVQAENAFSMEDFEFFTSLANHVAGVINNVRLLDESKNRALQLETAAEIARDISGSLNLDELLIKAVNLIRERFNFYHAAVFLQDLAGEFALIREATGEAGAQLKRAGHKIGVGSKSVVGFVTGRGEKLVVNDTTKDVTYYANPLLPDTRSEAALPLKVGERILGALDVQSNKPFAFNDDNLNSLQILADQIAIAVVNTELFAETQEHLSQHRLLHHITTTAASGTTLEEALDSAVQGLQVTLGGDRVTILLADREKKNLEIKASMGYAEDITNVRVAVGTGLTGWVAANRRPLRIKDVLEDPRYIQVSSNTRSELAIPLIYRNELLGVLNVESEQVDAYSENDEEMLGTLGGSLAAIIANARLLEQIRQQAERERLVYEITSKIRRSTDIQSILTTTASELTRITGSRQTKIKILTNEKDEKAVEDRSDNSNDEEGPQL